MERLLSKKEVAEILGISESKLNKDMLKGLPYYRVGKLVKFKLDEVLTYYRVGG